MISGHGEHKIEARLGKKLAENDKEQVHAQKDILGDVLVSVTGDLPHMFMSLLIRERSGVSIISKN